MAGGAIHPHIISFFSTSFFPHIVSSFSFFFSFFFHFYPLSFPFPFFLIFFSSFPLSTSLLQVSTEHKISELISKSCDFVDVCFSPDEKSFVVIGDDQKVKEVVDGEVRDLVIYG